jgi:hypothetical protein
MVLYQVVPAARDQSNLQSDRSDLKTVDMQSVVPGLENGEVQELGGACVA